MKLLIGIATYHRIEKLHRCIKSIKASTYQNFEIMVICDNMDLDTAEEIRATYPEIIIDVQPSHKYVIGAWNLCVQSNIDDPSWDGFIGLCDDVELTPEALEEIVACHKFTFPDTDGVMGFNQECPGYSNYTFKWFGQTLMGRKFIERYKEANYQICCPDYKHFFQDEEMYEFASSLNKFYSCPQALLKHYHPGFIKSEIDETHNIIRHGNHSPKEHDIKIRNARILKSYLWGKDFNRINNV